MIVRDFLICLLQMYLLEDLEKNMLPYRRENFLGKFLVYFVIALVMLGINHLESSIFNMVMIPVTYMIVSMVVFRGNIWKKLVIVCCYYVLAIIPEFLFATLTNAYGVTGASEGFGTEIEKTLALLLMSTMTFLFIKCINQVTRKRDYLTIENKTFTVLLMLPTATIIILGCVFYSNISFEGMNRVMVPVGASLLLLTNIFIFSVFDRFVEKSEEVKKMARLYQKSRAEIANLQYMNKVNEDIDIKQPLARQEKILSKANVIVELDEKKVNMILQNLEYRLEKHPEFQNPIAYVIFTSGSTGEPKGVVMSHTAAQNTLISIENMYNISEEDTILGIAELSFDLSVFDIFSVLGVGGTLVLPNPEKGPDASHWGRLLNEYKVTLWNSVPAQAEMLDAFASKSESYPTVRLVLLSGDWINTSLPGRLRKIMTNAQMISLGGATEGGIWSIYHEIDEIEERPTILYGKALLGQWMGVVDEELRICPEYVSGQIAIGGYSLAEGYLGDTTLTKEKFVYVEEEKNRIYLTGDNGRYVENGDIEFLGRLDNQVKINGHRIEIAEIENAIRGMQNIEDCCVVYNQSIGKGVLIAFIKNKISSISYTKEEYRKQLAFFLPPAMIPSEFVNVERFPLSTNGKIDRKGLAESIQKNIKVKHNAKATLISQKKEYVELAKSIKKIVCSISGNDYIDYEDNLLENGLDSLLLSQISGRIVSDIQEAQGMRFDEILRASLTMPTIMGIAQYISDCKNPSKNQMHSNAGNQTRNSYTVVYIFGDNENEIRDVLIEKLSASNISCKRVGGQEIIERCHEDISVKKKYIIAFSEMASLCITKASELLGENIIINRIFLINPSKAKESDLYLGDISIIDGNSVAIKSWEKAVLGNVREFESNSNDIFDIIMRELENDK